MYYHQDDNFNEIFEYCFNCLGLQIVLIIRSKHLPDATHEARLLSRKNFLLIGYKPLNQISCNPYSLSIKEYETF